MYTPPPRHGPLLFMLEIQVYQIRSSHAVRAKTTYRSQPDLHLFGDRPLSRLHSLLVR